MKKKLTKGWQLTGIAGALLAATTLMATSAVHASNAEAFYDGKTIRFMNSTGAGGTMDLYLLLVMKHMEKHLPARTRVVLEHRTGAGGAIGSNYLFSNAPKDGTYIGMPVPAIVSATFSTPEQARYDPTEFNAIGRVVDLPRAFIARSDSGITSFEDAAAVSEPVTFGIMSVGTSFDQFMTVANEAIGTNFRRVPGYTGGGPTFLAVEQGEVVATVAEPANLLANKWHLVEDGSISVLGTLSLEPVQGLEQFPNIMDLIPEDHPRREIATAVAQSAGIGLSLFAPPGVPAERVEYLREALRKTMADPDFIAEAEERRIPVSYASGEWLEELMHSAANVSPEVQAWFLDLTRGN